MVYFYVDQGRNYQKMVENVKAKNNSTPLFYFNHRQWESGVGRKVRRANFQTR
ncbi:MAG: hypothetical protein HQK58_03395 [Deltaproteobacteria bacterium]|nr:hypothetical protein [Deltaproteobacteria bacterium]